MDRRERLARAALYFVVEARPHGRDAEPLLDAALRGGVDVVQLREKVLGDAELLEAAQPFRRACGRHGALFIVNDRADLAVEAGADGVHVGQEDMDVGEARTVVGSERLVGLSTHSAAQITAADGADYIGVGTIFATPTKPQNEAAGLELVRTAAQVARVPWFAIGGIEESNIGEVVAAGARAVAVVRAIRDAGDPEAAARRLRSYLAS